MGSWTFYMLTLKSDMLKIIFKQNNRAIPTSGFLRQTADEDWYSERRSPSSDISVSRPAIVDICHRKTENQDTATSILSITTRFCRLYSQFKQKLSLYNAVNVTFLYVQCIQQAHSYVCAWGNCPQTSALPPDITWNTIWQTEASKYGCKKGPFCGVRNTPKCVTGWGSTRIPLGEAHYAPLVGWGGIPLRISRFFRLGR